MAEMNPELKAWYEYRVKTVHEKVTVYDILRRQGISLRHTTDRMEQIPCPFHGKDANPSARVYPGDPNTPSHIWCFVCREHWDAIGLWKKFGGDETKKFHRVLSELEKSFGITPPDISSEVFKGIVVVDNKDQETFERLYQQCTDRLICERSTYVRLGDMKGYLVAGSILDKALYQVSERSMTYKEGADLMTRLMNRIGERIRKSAPPSEIAHP